MQLQEKKKEGKIQTNALPRGGGASWMQQVGRLAALTLLRWNVGKKKRRADVEIKRGA